MKNYLPFFQVGVSLILILLILFQQRGGALGSIFGQTGFYASRRGFEKKIFWATIFLGILFIFFALLNLILK